MSLSPIIARRITGGKKKYDYRRTIFKKEVSHIYIYAASPVRKIVCRFTCSGYLSGSIDEIWERTGEFSLATEAEYRDYFKGKKIAYAIPITDLTVFEHPVDPYKTIPGFRPPQSFMYIKDGTAHLFDAPG
jgi:predicted transcriptional regulator